MDIKIADRAAAPELARFFCTNVDAEYISHAELQGYRAEALGRWAQNLDEVILSEIMDRFVETPAQTGRFVVEGRDRGILVAMSLLELRFDAIVPYCTLEDLIVQRNSQGSGFGQAMVTWIFAFAHEHKIRRVFLESGRQNRRAHAFFKQIGFQPVSMVMMREV